MECSISHTIICISETIAGAKNIRTTRQSNTGEGFRRDCAVQGEMTGEKSNLELKSMREVCRSRISHIPKSSPLKSHAWNCQSCKRQVLILLIANHRTTSVVVWPIDQYT